MIIIPKGQAQKRLIDYLNEHNIHYDLINDTGKLMDIRDLNTVYISFHVEQAPDSIIECSVWFRKSGMEIRGYYSKNAAEWCSTHANRFPEVFAVINFINARVFLGNLLYTPRLYLTADNHPEFAITTIIPYDFFELAPLETLEYITIYYPELLGKLSSPLFMVLLEKITPEIAIYQIKHKLLGETDSQIECRGDD